MDRLFGKSLPLLLAILSTHVLSLVKKPIFWRGNDPHSMKPTFLSLIYILVNALVANGQLATIKDPDGYTNVRAGSGVNAKIIGEFHVGDVFGYGEEKNGWVNVIYYPADSFDTRILEGYIHKDRLLPIYDLQRITENSKKLTNGHLELRTDSLTVELITAPFQPNQHVLEKDQGGSIQKIDGKRPLGTDGEMPLEKLTSLRVTISGNKMDIPATAWENLYNPTLETCKVFVNISTGFMYISLTTTHISAGGYEMVWIFKSGRYVRRYVDQSND
jgi:hypothetical protein